eukprot:Seg2289.2 transcript_id=Seg2289.2/GoldUCD/mRNA.D3Y31 product="Ubiquitin carboxyl-terminal hydrolase 15" protein_id=Seg2289.2/GoldUCD/D3Y31
MPINSRSTTAAENQRISLRVLNLLRRSGSRNNILGMSSANGSSEVEFEADICGSGSKLSDDSGIEDTWNEENLSNMPSATNLRAPVSITGEGATVPLAEEVSVNNLNPLVPQDDKSRQIPYGPANISTSAPTLSTQSIIRCDVKDSSAKVGVCGIENLGNTCFMNAGLQCIFATRALQKLILNDMSLGSITNAENSQAMIRMVEKFQDIFKKALSGEYKYLYPVHFHKALTQVHTIFGDRKQHDCQEFVSFLLNGLHDALNRVNPRRRFLEAQSSRESSPGISGLRLETSSESDNDESDGPRAESCKRMRLNNVDMEPDVGVECDEKLSEAQIAWRNYLEQNRSVIVDTYQGQFKSMVTCEKCHHVSVTYEPFMYVSVPIPHANEKQVVLHYRSLPQNAETHSGLQTDRYLITVSKNATVGDVKKQFIKTLKAKHEIDRNSLVMAEVSNSALNRTLVDDMKLQFLSSKSDKLLYAIEGQKFDISNQEFPSCMQSSDLENSIDSSSIEGIDYDENSSDVLPREGPMGWHTCGICLEDIFDDDLMVHNICGGVLCCDCLEATASYHSGQSFPCPVCNATVKEKTFTEISSSTTRNRKVRTILVPVLMRYSSSNVASTEKAVGFRDQFCSFGHPSVLLLPYQVRIIDIHKEILKIMPLERGLEYSLLFTDSQGVTCSRCDTFSDCSGCILEGEERIQFRPGDHLTIHFDDISQDLINKFSYVNNDHSMTMLRSGDTIELKECFQYFSECEVLSEDNPWFCPKCRRNQVATKAISVSRWPDVLIVHLKRFHFEGLQSVKVTSPVDFPLSNFCLDFVCSAETSAKENCVYDLTGCVCHTGSLTSGHYTSYSKNFVDSKWYHFNDDVTCEVDPREIDFEKVYMLFYQKIATGNLSQTSE